MLESAAEKQLGQALIECRPEALPAAWRRYHPMVRSMLRRALGVRALDHGYRRRFIGLADLSRFGSAGHKDGAAGVVGVQNGSSPAGILLAPKWNRRGEENR